MWQYHKVQRLIDECKEALSIDPCSCWLVRREHLISRHVMSQFCLNSHAKNRTTSSIHGTAQLCSLTLVHPGSHHMQDVFTTEVMPDTQGLKRK